MLFAGTSSGDFATYNVDQREPLLLLQHSGGSACQLTEVNCKRDNSILDLCCDNNSMTAHLLCTTTSMPGKLAEANHERLQ